MTAQLIATIDGGGTGTRVRVLSPDGRVLGTGTGGPSSLTFGVAPAWRSIGAALGQALGSAVPAGMRLWCGLAGGRSPERRAEFRAADPIAAAEIAIVTDGVAALYGALGARPGAILAIGTGVAAEALTPDGRLRSASGWGFAVGDEGGGAWIGRRAVSALTRAMDGRAPGGAQLCAALGGILGADFDAVQRWLATANPTRFAALAPVVVAAADADDPVARAILSEAAAEAEIALAAIARTGPVACLGGLAPVLTPRFGAGLRRRLVAPEGGVLEGLALMAQGWPRTAEALRHAWA